VAFAEVSGHIAAGDCERIRDGLIAQPANFVSSAAYCVVGGWLWQRSRSDGRARWKILSALSVAAGLGSMAYHGPGGHAGKLFHDTSAVVLVATAVAMALPREGTRPRGEVLGLACATTGISLHWLSRTDRPLCCPDCALQGHAVWHVLSAVAVAAVASAHVRR
jgi:hypothetical protein